MKWGPVRTQPICWHSGIGALHIPRVSVCVCLPSKARAFVHLLQRDMTLESSEKSVFLSSVVPTLFDIRDQFRGRQFFYRLE